MIRWASCHVDVVGASERLVGYAAESDEWRESSVGLAEVLITKVDVIVERVEGDGIDDVIVVVF